MDDPRNLEYLRTRARQERGIAITSEDNCVALVHFRMADEYERRAQLLEGRVIPTAASIRGEA